MTCWNVIRCGDRDLQQRRGEHVQARAARVAASRGGTTVCGVRPACASRSIASLAREPAQVRGVEDALGLARPAAAGEVRVGAPVGDVREADDRRSRPGSSSARVAAQRRSTGPSGARGCRRRSGRRSGRRARRSAARRRRSRGRAGSPPRARTRARSRSPTTSTVLALLERRAGRPGRAARGPARAWRVRGTCCEDLRPGTLVGRGARARCSGRTDRSYGYPDYTVRWYHVEKATRTSGAPRLHRVDHPPDPQLPSGGLPLLRLPRGHVRRRVRAPSPRAAPAGGADAARLRPRPRRRAAGRLPARARRPARRRRADRFRAPGCCGSSATPVSTSCAAPACAASAGDVELDGAARRRARRSRTCSPAAAEARALLGDIHRLPDRQRPCW